MTEVVRDEVVAVETVEVSGAAVSVESSSVSVSVASAAYPVVVTGSVPVIEIVSTAQQGPPGPQGERGPTGDAGGAFLVTNRFNELLDDAAKAAARVNLQLQNIDCGEFL